jgi:hypothetical protein
MFHRFIVFVLTFLLSNAAWAHHSPGSTGGGLSVESAETLPQGEVSFSYRVDYTSFQGIYEQEIQDMTMAIAATGAEHVHLDAARQSVLQTMALSYGIADDLQVSWGFLGTYRAIDMREGHTHSDLSYGYHSFGDINGATDSWVTSKWQALKGEEGKLALVGGVKIPIGTTDARSQEPPSPTNSRILGLDLQPSTGAIDGTLGLAFTRLFSEQVSLDVDTRYTLRGYYKDFKAGDRLDGGVALAYKLLKNEAGTFSLTPFLEGNAMFLARNQEWDTDEGEWHEEVNTGGLSFFLSPGVKIAAGRNFSVALSFQLPVIQDLNSFQQKIDYKATAAMTASF